MRYRIIRVSKKYYPQGSVNGFPLTQWWDIDDDGEYLEYTHRGEVNKKSEAEALKNIEKHKAIEAEENDIEELSFWDHRCELT